VLSSYIIYVKVDEDKATLPLSTNPIHNLIPDP